MFRSTWAYLEIAFFSVRSRTKFFSKWFNIAIYFFFGLAVRNSVQFQTFEMKQLAQARRFLRYSFVYCDTFEDKLWFTRDCKPQISKPRWSYNVSKLHCCKAVVSWEGLYQTDQSSNPIFSIAAAVFLREQQKNPARYYGRCKHKSHRRKSIVIFVYWKHQTRTYILVR